MSETQKAVAVQQQAPPKSLVAILANQYDMEPAPFLEAIRQTVMPSDKQVSNGQIAAFLMVCHEHHLNPFTREIYAFPAKSGGIQPIVSIDGWVKLINQHPQYNGMDLTMEVGENGKPVSCTCTIYRKDRDRAIPITEYYDECYRNTDPWNKMGKRMMRHKAVKEAARYTFGFAGIVDEDEARDMVNITGISTEMERSTLDAKENLKAKIDKMKPVQTAAPKQEAPVVETQPVQPVEVETAPQVAEEPIATVIEPQPTVETAPEDMATIDHKRAFLAAVKAKAQQLGIGDADMKKKAQEILHDLGFSKFADVPQSKIIALHELVEAWSL
jgi:phage recombination protein Bet